jgi:hypothetical protein
VLAPLPQQRGDGIALADGAQTEHYRVLLDQDAYHVGVTRVRQGAIPG